MRELRRHLPKAVSPLEMLDERVVPSVIGFAPMRHAAQAEHSSFQGRRFHFRHAQQFRNPSVTPFPSSTSTIASPSFSGSGSGATAAVIPSPTTGDTATQLVSPSAVTTPSVTSPSPSDIKNGPLAKAGQDLITIYQEFQQQGDATFTSSKAGLIEIQGTNVGVDVHMAAGIDFNAFVSGLTKLGMQVRAQDATNGTVEGLLPISQLPSVAQNPQTLSVSPIYLAAT